MAAFPTIYRYGTTVQKPRVDGFEDTMAHDPTIRSGSEGGYVASRARFTRISRKWTVRYEWMSQTNKNTLKTFEDARKAGAESFTWTHPETSTSYTVRFMEPIRYTPHPYAKFLWWMVEFVLEQV